MKREDAKEHEKELVLYEKVYKHSKRIITIVIGTVGIIISASAIVSFANIREFILAKAIEKIVTDSEIKNKIVEEVKTAVFNKYDKEFSAKLQDYDFYVTGAKRDLDAVIEKLKKEISK